MPDVIAFGELMMRLATHGAHRFSQSPHFEITFGGAEANVAVAISQLGGSAGFVTKLPENPLADRALSELRSLGVGVASIARGGSRIGTYFLEQGAGVRSAQVIYDRAHSAISEAQPGDFDWPLIFQGARWLHCTGITPAISADAAAITATACEAARAAGVGISFDVNYRSKLWSATSAGATLRPLLKGIQLCVTSVEEAAALFGILSDETAPVAARAEQVALALVEVFGIEKIAITFREAVSAESTRWGAMLWAEGKAWHSRMYGAGIVDRIGAGDAFTGALIFALLRGDAPQAAVDLAAAAGALKHSIWGDYLRADLTEVEALVSSPESAAGRVRR